MKTKFYLIAALAVLSLAACKKDPQDDPSKKEDTIEFTGKIDCKITKSALNGQNVEWSEGDQISVFNGVNGTKTQTNVLYVSSEISGAQAKFTTKVKKIEEQAVYAAIYPYNSGCVLNGTKISYTLPGAQNFVENGFAAGAFPMVASSSSKELSFKGVCGIFQIPLTGEGQVITTLEIEGLNVAGACNIDAATGALEITEGSNKISLQLPSDGVKLSSTPTVFNVVVPAANYAAIMYTVYDADGGQMDGYDENVAVSVNAVTTASRTEYNNDHAKPAITDLSDEGYANCYMINSPGKYQFDAARIDENGKNAKVEGAKVDWIWVSNGEWEKEGDASVTPYLQDLKLENGVISFTVPEPFAVGNVCVGVLDSSNTCIWTWHLWFTGRVANLTVGGYEFMDRNLGAGYVFDANGTVEKEINAGRGLLYQWGRKDPLPGPRRGDSAEETAFTQGSTTYYKNNTAVNYVDAAFVRVNPTTVIEGFAAKSTDATKLPTAAIAGVANLPSQGSTWNVEANPCPYGYEVPSYDGLYAALAASPITIVENIETANCHAVIGGSLNFPRVGYRNIGNGPLSGVNVDGRYWVSSRGNSTNANQGWWCQIGAGYAEGYTIPYVKPDKDSATGASKAHAASVRCMKKK